ncbi:hypothetical protein DFP72DRAFT_1166169 [Ephemerocybe angulata]|uniref:Uncharacterized protein n=1 Tax=Ephemerocybe angulata TaxID=980116 RepID=A0A8H6IAF9_9AGAR|nr:hypothetical protein DFP72DRAFT_1166169 [Tulosesus angulatus]
MVQISTAAVIAAAIIAPSIAAPIAQLSEEFEARARPPHPGHLQRVNGFAPGHGPAAWIKPAVIAGGAALGIGLGAGAAAKGKRELSIEDEVASREFEDKLEVRAGGAGRGRAALNAFGALSGGAGLATAIAPLFQNKQKREFEETELSIRAGGAGRGRAALHAFGTLTGGAGLATAIAPLFKSNQQKRSFEGLDLEERSPAVNFAAMRKWVKPAVIAGGGALGIGLGAGAAAKSRREFDEIDARDFEDFLDYYSREFEVDELD